MIFLSDKFIFNGIESSVMNIRLVDTEEKNILMNYGAVYTDNLAIENTFGGIPLYSKEYEKPEEITLQFCLVDELGEPIEWTSEKQQKIVDWLVRDEFCEFISYDSPNLIYYLKATKVKREFNYQKKGMLNITYQPYYHSPIQKNVSILKGSGNLNIFNQEKRREFIYPVIEISNATGVISIKNNSIKDSQSFEIKDLEQDDKVRIDCSMYVIEGNNKKDYFSMLNREWLKIKKGENTLSITGNGTVKIKFNIEVNI